MPARPIALVLLSLLLAGCASLMPTPDARLQGDAARPARAAGWVRSELYFGLGPAAGGPAPAARDAREQDWRRFLDAEVTPRFPDGLTVLDAYGQWLVRETGAVERLHTKVLVVLHEDTPRRRADIDAIRSAWKQAAGEESVLWSRQPVEVSF
jgi:hypothetical protein